MFNEEQNLRDRAKEYSFTLRKAEGTRKLTIKDTDSEESKVRKLFLHKSLPLKADTFSGKKKGQTLKYFVLDLKTIKGQSASGRTAAFGSRKRKTESIMEYDGFFDDIKELLEGQDIDNETGKLNPDMSITVLELERVCKDEHGVEFEWTDTDANGKPFTRSTINVRLIEDEIESAEAKIRREMKRAEKARVRKVSDDQKQHEAAAEATSGQGESNKDEDDE